MPAKITDAGRLFEQEVFAIPHVSGGGLTHWCVVRTNKDPHATWDPNVSYTSIVAAPVQANELGAKLGEEERTFDRYHKVIRFF